MSKFLTILSALLVALVTSNLSAQTDPASSQMIRKVDSLFVIASSGELKYRDKVEPAIDAIAKIGKPAVPHLIDKFTTNSARERLTIINILTKIGSPAVPDLVSALSRKEWLVVKRVCWALGDIKDKNAIGPLVQISSHSNWQVREYCIGALGKIGSDDGLVIVLKAFEDSVGQVRKAAAYATGAIKNSDAIPALVNALGDDFYGARFAAMEALMTMDTSVVISELAAALQTATGLKANVICQTLGRLKNDAAINVLSIQLSSSNSEIRNYAAFAIVDADPLNQCGFYDEIKSKITDRLALVRIESARKSVHLSTDAAN